MTIKLKLSFFNKLELFILGFDHRKISKWLNNKNVLKSKRGDEIEEEWQKMGGDLRGINKYLNSIDKNNFVKDKKFRASVKKIDKLSIKLKKLKRERDRGSVIFNNFFEFALFTSWFSFTFLGNTGFRNIKHEWEHARVYKKYKIVCYYGWQKIFSEKSKDYAFFPFVGARASWKIHMESGQAAKKPSPHDKLQIKLIKKYNAT